MAPSDRTVVRADMRVPADKVDRDVHGLRKDGTPFDMCLAVVAVTDGNPTRPTAKGYYFFIRDLTERRRMENQLIFAGRMAAVGTLAAGVAHEINNPLAYIVANIDFVRHQMTTLASRLTRGGMGGDDLRHTLDETGEALAEARQGTERVRNIVRDLRVFARGQEELSGPVALRRVLDSSINIAWNEIRHRARLVKDFGETPMVEANEGRLGQVFLNLLLNAAHAIPEGATERNEIRVSTRTDARGFAVVEVRDTGTGIPAEIQARFSIRSSPPSRPRRGPVSASDLQRHPQRARRRHRVDSDVGAAARSGSRCPRWRSRRPARRRRGAFAEAEAQGGRMLIVDDEPMILGALRRSFASDYESPASATGARRSTRARRRALTT